MHLLLFLFGLWLIILGIRIMRSEHRRARAEARAAQEISDAFGRVADEIERRDATPIEGERYTLNLIDK